MTAQECILALDVGSSSVRALAFDCQGRVLDVEPARRPLRMAHSPDGGAHMDALQLLDNIWACIDDYLARLPNDIKGVATCTFVHSLMGLDDNDEPLTQLSTYADTSSAPEAEELKHLLDERQTHDRVGARFHPGYMPPKLLRFSRVEPELFARVRRWLSIGEFMSLQLFGQARVSHSVASWSGALDRRKLCWDDPLLQTVGTDQGLLSPIAEQTGADLPSQQGLVPRFASRWPRLAEIPWFVPLGDGAAANIGCGAVDNTSAAVTIGTSAAVRAVTPSMNCLTTSLPFGLFCYRVDRDRLLPGGALSEGGNVFAWLKDLLGLTHANDLDSALAATVPDGHGLTILPLAAGERSPGWRGDARATIQGLSLATGKLDILRAGLEAVTLRIARVYQDLKPFLAPNHKVLAGGGALRGSTLWPQLLADVLGVEVTIPDMNENSARGAALLAWESLGEIDLAETAPLSGATYTPTSEHHEVYRDAGQRQQALYDTLLGHPDKA